MVLINVSANAVVDVEEINFEENPKDNISGV